MKPKRYKLKSHNSSEDCTFFLQLPETCGHEIDCVGERTHIYMVETCHEISGMDTRAYIYIFIGRPKRERNIFK